MVQNEMHDGNGNGDRRVEYAIRFTQLETQVERLISDAESEKETRRRANLAIHEDIEKSYRLLDTRISQLEQKAYWLTGAVAVLVLIIQFVFKH